MMKKFLLIALLLSTYPLASEDADRVAKIKRYLNKAAQNGYSGSVLVSLQGRILLEEGYGMANREKGLQFTPETIFDIGSITKQFTAAAILKLEQKKKLKVQDPITKYFDEVPDDKKMITLHELLTHTAGLPGAVGEDEELIGKEEYLKRVFSTPLIHPPGTYDYSNVGFSLLAAIVENVSGQEYEHYLREQLLIPAGMMLTGYVLPAWDKQKMATGYRNQERWGTTYEMSQYQKGVTWHLKGNGGIHSTVGDMHRWYVALNGTSIFPDEVKQKYFAPHVNIQEGSAYGYGWGIRQNERKEKVITHNGGNGFFMDTMVMIPERDFNIVVSTNDATKNTDRIATRVQRILFDNPEELTDSFLQIYAGEYILPSGATIPISFNENDDAVLELNQNEPWMVYGGNDSDDLKIMEPFNQKTKLLLQALSDGNVQSTAEFSGLTKEEASEIATGFRDRLEKEHGKCNQPSIIGTVGRQKGRYHLTLVDFKCEKEQYQTVIWQGEKLFEIRPMPEGNTKLFEHRKGNEFFAENNNRALFFEQQNGIAILKATVRGKQIVARKEAVPKAKS